MLFLKYFYYKQNIFLFKSNHFFKWNYVLLSFNLLLILETVVQRLGNTLRVAPVFVAQQVQCITIKRLHVGKTQRSSTESHQARFARVNCQLL